MVEGSPYSGRRDMSASEKNGFENLEESESTESLSVYEGDCALCSIQFSHSIYTSNYSQIP